MGVGAAKVCSKSVQVRTKSVPEACTFLCEHECHSISKESDTKKEENQQSSKLAFCEAIGVFAPLLGGFAWEIMPFARAAIDSGAHSLYNGFTHQNAET